MLEGEQITEVEMGGTWPWKKKLDKSEIYTPHGNGPQDERVACGGRRERGTH